VTDPLGLQCQPGQANCPFHPPSCHDMNCVWQYYNHMASSGWDPGALACYQDSVETDCGRVLTGINNDSLNILPPVDEGWQPVRQQSDCPGCWYNPSDQVWDPSDPRTWGGMLYASTLTADARTILTPEGSPLSA
jgi:hypothetical protein